MRNRLFKPSLQDERRRPPKFIEQLVTINLTALILGVRRNAEAAGFDLGAPLFLMPEDPGYASIHQELAKIAKKEKLQIEKGSGCASRIASAHYSKRHDPMTLRRLLHGVGTALHGRRYQRGGLKPALPRTAVTASHCAWGAQIGRARRLPGGAKPTTFVPTGASW